MRIKIVKNKYLNALLLLMLFSAIAHMVILFYFAIVSGNAYILNYFNILDADLLYLNAFNNFWGNVFSAVFVMALYFIILRINRE